MRRSILLTALLLVLASMTILQACKKKSSPAAPAPAPTATPTPDCGHYGYDTIGALSGLSTNYLQANPWTVSFGPVTVTRLFVYTGGAGEIRAAVYSDSSGPASVLTQSASVSATGAGWQTLDVPDTVLAAGTYWLGVEQKNGSGNILRYDNSGTTRFYAGSLAWGALPDIPSGANATGSISAYIELCPKWPCYNGSPYGYATVGGLSGLAANFLQANPFTVSSGPVTAFKLAVYTGGAGEIRAAIYSDSSGPATVLAQSAPVSATGTGWQTLDIPETPLANGTYWIGIEQNGSADILHYDNSGTARFYAGALAWGPLMNNPSGSSSSGSLSTYVETCP